MGDAVTKPTEQSTVTFVVKREWTTAEMTRFCEAVGTLYGIFLVQSAAAADEDCARLLREWDKSIDIVLAYHKSNNASYTEGNLVIEAAELHPQGRMELKGWSEPIGCLQDVLNEVSRLTMKNGYGKAAKRSLPRAKSLAKTERLRLVSIVQSCLADIETLGAMVC